MAGKFLKRPESSLSFWRKIRRSIMRESRASFGSGEIRIADSRGNLERVILFNEANRKAVTRVF